MKRLVFAITLLASNFAFSDIHRSGVANFSSLYDGFNAGVYHVEVKVTPKEHLVTGTPSKSIVHDDGQNFCVTTVKFEIGTAELKLTSGEWNSTQKYPVTALISNRSDDETCDTSIFKLEGETKFYVALSNDAVTLPVQAPAGYDSVRAYMTPFSGYLNSSAFIDLDKSKQVIEPKEVLNDSKIISMNSHSFNLGYYVISTDGRGLLSLANGILTLK